jgi:single-strand DNA-binding protein
LNRFELEGNLTKDPEVKEAGENTVTVLGVAETREKANGEKEPQYFDVEIWGQLGQNVADSMRKGDMVQLLGNMRYDSYEDGEGKKRSRIKLVATQAAASLRFATVNVKKPEKATV